MISTFCPKSWSKISVQTCCWHFFKYSFSLFERLWEIKVGGGALMTVTVTVTVPNYIGADCLGCDEVLRQSSQKSLYEWYFLCQSCQEFSRGRKDFIRRPRKIRSSIGQPDSIFNHRIIYFRYPAGFCSEASDCRKGQVVFRNHKVVRIYC